MHHADSSPMDSSHLADLPVCLNLGKISLYMEQHNLCIALVSPQCFQRRPTLQAAVAKLINMSSPMCCHLALQGSHISINSAKNQNSA